MQILAIYARCRNLPARYIETFEEMFTTGFITSDEHIFGPHPAAITARYVAVKDAEEGITKFLDRIEKEKKQRQYVFKHI